MEPAKTSVNQSNHSVENSKKRFMMPMVVLGLLGGHVTFIVLAITFATGNESFAVVPDYYQKAVAFDDRKAALAASEILGWSVELEAAKVVTEGEARGVVVRLHDQSGAVVRGATVNVNSYHLSRADEPIAFTLVEALPGQYVGQAPLDREGFWRFELDATVGETRFVNDFQQFVFAAEESK